MELSQFVAQLLGITYLAVGIGFLNSRKHYEKMLNNFVKDPAVMYLGGLMALIIGFLLVTYHNIWVKNWTVLITILGWGALLKGVLLLAIPKTQSTYCRKARNTLRP